MSVGAVDEAGVVAGAIRSLGHSNVWEAPPAAWLCPDPILVTPGEWERESLQLDGSERGRRRVRVLVCCEDPRDARATARSVADGLAGVAWEALRGEGLRVVAADVGRPAPVGRDGSGRWLWDLEVAVTSVVGEGR